MLKKLVIIITLICFVLAGVLLFSPVHTLANSAVSLAARQSCSLHFAAGLPLPWLQQVYVNPHIKPAGPLIQYQVQSQQQWVEASLLGLYKARAKLRKGYGCTLEHGETFTEIKPYPTITNTTQPINNEARQRYFDNTKLNAALTNAFNEPDASNPRQSVAILVLHKGELVAERYAPGIRQTTPLPGYSMAKSVTATLIGLLVQDNKLGTDDVVKNAAELSEAGVNIDQLLRMTSGIDVEENGSGLDPNSVMLTQQADAAGYAIQRGLAATPGQRYAYTGAGPVLLAQQFNDLAGNNASDAYQYIYQKLLKPMQLGSVVLEADSKGTFLGSSFMLASALDWAKLGQLYLQNGNWQGQQLLPTFWQDYVKTFTPQSGQREYGAGFWVAYQGGRDSRHPQLPAPPRNSFFMHGMMNQGVYILPSQQLIIVRLGATRKYLLSGEQQLVADVIAAMH